MSNRSGLSTVLITGASSGIGLYTAKELAKSGFTKLVLTARRKDRLDNLKTEIEAEYPGISVYTAALDVTDTEAVLKFPSELPDGFKEIDVILANAGMAKGRGPLAEYDISDLIEMMNANVTGCAATIRAFLPGMISRGKGHVMATSSIAGKKAYPGGAFYCASKYAVEAMMTSLRYELVATPIKVSTISPGMVGEGTDFSVVRFGDADQAKAVYEGIDELKAVDIAETIAFMLTRPPNVQIADVLILCTNQADGMTISKKK